MTESPNEFWEKVHKVRSETQQSKDKNLVDKKKLLEIIKPIVNSTSNLSSQIDYLQSQGNVKSRYHEFQAVLIVIRDSFTFCDRVNPELVRSSTRGLDTAALVTHSTHKNI